MRILQESTVAVIIDVQERLFPVINKNEELLRSLNILSSGLSLLKVPIILTEQYPKGLGATVSEFANKFEEVIKIEKISFSCQDNEEFKAQLLSINKKNVIIAGIEAHVCVLQTVIDLIQDGYQPIVVEDCISSRRKSDKKVAIERMKKEGAIITTYESILLELCRSAGTDTFKAISNLIK